MGNELAADGADSETVQFQFVVVFAEACDGSRIVGVHHPDLLAHSEALIPGMLLFPTLKYSAAGFAAVSAPAEAPGSS